MHTYTHGHNNRVVHGLGRIGSRFLAFDGLGWVVGRRNFQKLTDAKLTL